jgi:hypothetical protein
MAHETTTKISEDIRRSGCLCQYIGTIESALNFEELKMTGSSSLMHKMHMEINMLGSVTAADRSFRPSDACLIVRKYRSGRCLRKTEIVKTMRKKITS